MTQRPVRSVLLAAAGLLTLAGCATATASTQAGLRPELSASAKVETAAPAADDGGTAFGLYLAGEAAIDGGASRMASTYFGKASALEPGDPSVRARAFSSALVAGEVGRAAEEARGFTAEGDPLQRLGLLTQAVEALAEDHGKQAHALLSIKLTGTQHDQAIQLVQPWVAGAAGDWSAATLPQPMMADPVTQGVAELGRAELLERNGRLTEAEAILKPRAATKDGLFILGYGGFLERRGRKADALAVYDHGAQLLPGDAGIQSAKLRLQAGKPAPILPSFREGAAEALIAPAALMVARREGDNGLAYLRLALRLDPSLDEAWVLVGDAMSGAGDAEAAKEAYRRIKPGSVQFIPARSRLVLMAQQAGDKDEALRLAREMLDAAPADVRPLVLYADLLRDDERFPEAVQAADRAIRLVGESEAGWSLWYGRGVAEERAGNWPAAEADLKRALKLKPDEPQILNYLGYAWADRGEHLKEALAMLEKAAQLSPRSGAIVDSLGWARYRTKNYRDATRDLEQAVLLDPSDPEVNNHLGDAYWRVGRQTEARFQWKRVLTLQADAKTRASAELKLAQGLGPDTDAARP